ncbi:MAG: hypothetical protein II244_06030 [Clostridia bacterium]|nr:hypothetical protein [Clostridia bacterium]
MEITKTIPAHNPADENTLDGLNNLLTDKISMGIQSATPAIVQSYNKNTNRAVVKPAITGVASQGQKISKEPYIDIPVLKLSGGGVTMSFPIKPGDTGWLIACDRNISIFKQNLQESAPNDYRKHKFEDSFFIPDSINGSGSDDFTIQSASQIFSIGDEINASTLKVGNGATGTFLSKDNKTITVENGIVTGIA